jgi:transposase
MTMTPAVLATRDNGVMDQPEPKPDPARARRRTFTAEKKLALVAEYDAATAQERGALLRREAARSTSWSRWLG